jgi:hypothetical protein
VSGRLRGGAFASAYFAYNAAVIRLSNCHLRKVHVQSVPNDLERPVRIFRESKWNVQFWLKSMLTLGLWNLLVYRHNSIELTTRRVIQHRGSILTKNDTSMSIANITDITVNQSFLGRVFSYGDITINSAGANSAEISARRYEAAPLLRDFIYDLRDGRLDEVLRR